jgi:hypothetical protein
MKLALASIAAGVLVGYISGGRVRNLVGTRLRWPGVALLGLVLQIVPLPGALSWAAFPLVVMSHAVLIFFALANIRSPGVVLILIGVVLNLVVIAANHGMPVTHHALVAAHDRAGIAELRHPSLRYHLAGPHDVLLFLSDAIGGIHPFQFIISVGDIGIYAGGATFVAWATRRKKEPEGAPGPVAAEPAMT